MRMKELKSWRDVERTAEDYKKFFPALPLFTALFGEEDTMRHLLTVPFPELVTVLTYKENDPSLVERGEFLGTTVRMEEEWDGEWRRDVDVTHFVYLMPREYQGPAHQTIIRALLAERFPWLADFRYEAYELYDENNDIYVQIESKIVREYEYLYVPLQALMNRDVEAIKKHNVDYFTAYHARNKLTDEQHATYVEKLLGDPVTKRFLVCVKEAAQ